MTRNTKPPLPNQADRLARKKSKPHAIHDHNPAGSKLVRWMYRPWQRQMRG